VLQSADSFTANYAGDTGYAAASATSANINVTAPDFNISTSQPGLTITAGQPASLMLTIAPNAPFAGSIQLQLTPPNPAINCNVSPSPLQMSGTSSVTGTLTCTVPAPSSSTSTTHTVPLGCPKLGPWKIWWTLSGLLAALAFVFWLLPSRVRMRRLAYASLLSATISFALGCGGSSGGGGGGGGGGSGGTGAGPTSTTLTVANTKVQPGSNLMATVQVNGNSPTGTVSLGVVGASYSINTKPLTSSQAQFSYYLGSPGGYLMTAQYSGDPRNLPSQIQTPLAVVQTGAAGNLTVTASIGTTRKQANVTVTVQ